MTEEEKLKKILSSAGKGLEEKWKNYLEISAGEYVPTANQIGQVKNLVSNIPSDVKSVLVIGAGDGTEMELIRDSGRKVKGIQINPVQVRECKDKGLDCKLMDMHQLTFKDEEFDMVFCKDAFKQAMSHIIVWSEFCRVSKTHIMISEPDNRWGWKAHNYLLLTTEQYEWLAEKSGWRIFKYWEIEMPYVTQKNYLFEKHKHPKILG